MSLFLWQSLPEGLLKMKYGRWDRLDYDVKGLIVDLANKQNFKCAFCDKGYDLEIEHDHSPEEGRGDRLTIYNIRGLACRRHNWHVMIWEKDEKGEYRGFDNVEPEISFYEYACYIDAYAYRVRPLLEDDVAPSKASHLSAGMGQVHHSPHIVLWHGRGRSSEHLGLPFFLASACP